MKVKKRVLGILAIILCLCFLFAGCDLLKTDPVKDAEQTAITVNGVVITKEDVKTAYDNYFESYYQQYSDKAFDKMIEDLVLEKLILTKADDLIESGDIVLSATEKNYLYDQTFKAVLTNLENFEEQAKKLLGLDVEDDDADEDDEDEPETNAQFVYTEYNPTAKVIYNETTKKYEIKIYVQHMIAKENEDGELEYEYVNEDEYASYTEPTELLSYSDFEYDKLESEDDQEKIIAREAKRIYLARLLKNEEGKNLSTDEASVFQRELERIYEIVYKNFASTKLYQYATKDIHITEDELLNYYISKVLENYERYQEDPELFEKEVMTSVLSANQWGSYGSAGFSIADIFYVPEMEESYFMVYHIIVKFEEDQVKRINDAHLAWKNGTISEEDYNKVVEDEKAALRLNERDEEGTIIVKSTDENAKTFDKMLEELNAELATATTAEEKGDIFNKYLYKYSTDTGSLQIQYDYFGGQHTNWYGYVVGTDDDGSYVEEFVEEARKLYDNGAGQLGDISDKFYMESWTTETLKDEAGNAVKDEDNKEIKIDKLSYGGFDVMMYAGAISNPFEAFDEEKFEVTDLGEDALKILTEKRLGLAGNKTLFDLLYEGIYSNIYNNLISDLKEDLKDDADVKYYENVYRDLNPLA